jgi:hypothetical protein
VVSFTQARFIFIDITLFHGNHHYIVPLILKDIMNSTLQSKEISFWSIFKSFTSMSPFLFGFTSIKREKQSLLYNSSYVRTSSCWKLWRCPLMYKLLLNKFQYVYMELAS